MGDCPTTPSGDDWNNRAAVGSGRGGRFRLSPVLCAEDVTRPNAELADNQAAAPTVFEGGHRAVRAPQEALADVPPARAESGGGFGGGTYRLKGQMPPQRTGWTPLSRPRRRARRGDLSSTASLAGHGQKRRIRMLPFCNRSCARESGSFTRRFPASIRRMPRRS